MNEREQFEAFASGAGKWPKAIERDSKGEYRLAQTASDWRVWQARAALAASPVPAGRVYWVVAEYKGHRVDIQASGGDKHDEGLTIHGDFGDYETKLARAREICAQLNTGLTESPVPAGWLPIESAPKLTKIVVAYRNSAGKWRRVLATYWPAETLESDHSNSGWADEGWYEATEAYEELAPLEGDPVCWSELPPINDASAPAPTMPNTPTESAASVSAPAQQAERECRHCGWLCRPNPAESQRWYPLTDPAPAPSVEAQADDMRERFEAYMSSNGTWAYAIERDSRGEYKLAQTASAWNVWQAALKEHGNG